MPGICENLGLVLHGETVQTHSVLVFQETFQQHYIFKMCDLILYFDVKFFKLSSNVSYDLSSNYE